MKFLLLAFRTFSEPNTCFTLHTSPAVHYSVLRVTQSQPSVLPSTLLHQHALTALHRSRCEPAHLPPLDSHDAVTVLRAHVRIPPSHSLLLSPCQSPKPNRRLLPVLSPLLVYVPHVTCTVIVPMLQGVPFASVPTTTPTDQLLLPVSCHTVEFQCSWPSHYTELHRTMTNKRKLFLKASGLALGHT